MKYFFMRQVVPLATGQEPALAQARKRLQPWAAVFGWDPSLKSVT